MTVVNSKKIYYFLSTFARILMFKHFRGDCAYADQFFCKVSESLFQLGRILDDFNLASLGNFRKL
jgi:hypothetical protein